LDTEHLKIFIIKTADDPCRLPAPLSRVKERLKLISRNNKDFKVQLKAEINHKSVAMLIDNVS